MDTCELLVRGSSSGFVQYFFEFLINSNRTMSLINIRGIVWNQIIRYCPTFVARDCNAEFSEIPSSDIFRSLSNEEKVLASSRYRV